MNNNSLWLRQKIVDLLYRFDLPLLIISLCLMTVGLLTVYSASFAYGHSQVVNQLLNLCVAFAVMWLFTMISPQQLMRFAVPLYIIGIVLLVLVLLTGTVVNGSRRWLSLGFVRVQPSEILKLAMPMFLAWYFHRLESAPTLRQYALAILFVLVPFLLIAKQPDLGTSLLIGSAGFFVIFFAGFPWKWIIAGICSLVIAFPALWSHLHGYQQRRILTLIDPSTDPQGSGYHIIQSTIAIGSGGIFGKGYLQGTQTHLEFIPERHTDFIFAVLSEEWGLLGAVVILILYSILIMRGIMIAASAQFLFEKLLAASITFSFFTYVFVNIGMVSGILPVVGVPLPFISYGGTALVIIFMGIGILMSIYRHRFAVR